MLEMTENANGIPQTGPPPVVVPAPLYINISLMMLFQIGGRLYRPRSLLNPQADSMLFAAVLLLLLQPIQIGTPGLPDWGFKWRFQGLDVYRPLHSSLEPFVLHRQYLRVLQHDGVVGTVCMHVFWDLWSGGTRFSMLSESSLQWTFGFPNVSGFTFFWIMQCIGEAHYSRSQNVCKWSPLSLTMWPDCDSQHHDLTLYWIRNGFVTRKQVV